MTTMASQITNLMVVYSTVYSDADQRKHQSSALLAFVWGFHRDRRIHHTKGQLRGKMFPFDDVIMPILASSWAGVDTLTFRKNRSLSTNWRLSSTKVRLPIHRRCNDAQFIPLCVDILLVILHFIMIHTEMIRYCVLIKLCYWEEIFQCLLRGKFQIILPLP